MYSSIRDLRYFAVTIGLIWMAAFLLLGWKFERPSSRVMAQALWIPGSGNEVQTSRPVPLIRNAGMTPAIRKALRLSIRAKHIGYDGGTLTCGRVTVVVPRGATEAGGFFLLEDASSSGLAFDFDNTAYDVSLTLTLRISYQDTQYGGTGLDPHYLRVCRETSAGVYERVTSWIDPETQQIVAETSAPGRYVVM